MAQALTRGAECSGSFGRAGRGGGGGFKQGQQNSNTEQQSQ